MSDRQHPSYGSLKVGIGNAIKGTRIKRHITLKQLAFATKISEEELYNIESGCSNNGSDSIDLWNYLAIAKRLGLPLDLEKVIEIGNEMGRIDNIEVEFFGIKAVASANDFLPIKNHLPHDLAVKLKTRKQWVELGFCPKTDAAQYELHPDMRAKRTFMYFHEDDVIDVMGNKADWLEEHQAEVLDALTKNAGHNSLNPRRLQF